MTRFATVSALTAALVLAAGFSLPATTFAATIPSGDVLINEFSSGSSADWVELYNASTSPIDLTGWKLEDLAHNSHTFIGTIAAHGFATTTFSNYLNNGGDEMYLFDTHGATSSAVAYGSNAATTTVDYEYAPTPASGESAYRTTDGGATWATTTYPTEGYSNVPCASVPPGTTLAVDATFKVSNDPDSGNVGAWAADAFSRHVQIWQAADGSYCAKADDTGTFTSYGAPSGISPNSGASLPEVVTGSFTGYTYGTVTGGILNAGAGAPADLDCSSAGTSCSTISYWVKHYFGDTATYNFGSGWSWTYGGGANGTWVDAWNANTGDIVHVRPATVYVDPTSGSDTNYGDATHPMKTVDAAMSAVADKGTVKLATSTTPYGDITISRPITLTSASSTDMAQIDGTVTVASASSTVSHLDITNPNAGYGVVVDGVSNVTVSGNTIHDIGTTLTKGSAQAIDLNGGSSASITNDTFSDNTITNVGTTTLAYDPSVSGTSAKGIYVGDSSGTGSITGLTISGNTISNVFASTTPWTKSPTVTKYGRGGYGVLINFGGATTASITGNTISNLSGYWAHGIGLEGDTPDTVVSSNTISHLTNNGSDSSALRLEDNPDATTVTGSGNTLDGTPLVVGADNVLVDQSAGTASGSTYPETYIGGAYRYTGLNVFPTVQDGVNGASAGATVSIAAGTYTEQVIVGRSLTLSGADEATTIIKSPATTLTALATVQSNGQTLKPVVSDDSHDLTLKNLTVDGDGQGNANYSFAGLGVRDANVVVDHVTITGVRETPLNGDQHGNALYLVNDDAAARTATVSNSTFTDFQKNAIVLKGAGLTVDVNHDTITGTGALAPNAQNGVEVYGGATGSVSDNTISDIECGTSNCGVDWYNDYQAIGIMLYAVTGPFTVSGNHVSNSDIGIYSQMASGAASMTDNVLTGNRYSGIAFEEGDATVSGGSVSGSVYGIFNPSEHGTGTLSVHDVDLSGNAIGMSATYATTTAAVQNDNGSFAIDATDNYWGSAAGPSVGTDVNGSGAAHVSYTPWYADSGMTTLKWPTTTSGGSASTTVSNSTTLTGTSTTASNVTVTATIPAGTTVTGSSSWDGTIAAPTATSTTISLAGSTVTTTSAVTVGSSKYDLIFSSPVELTFAGQAGKKVGFYDTAGTFSEITDTCDGVGTPTVGGNALATTSPGAACKVDSGSDLVVWTTHFSTFTTYTSVPNAPVMTPDGATFHGFVDVTMDDTASNAYVRYTTDGSTPTCSNGSGYANGQTLVFSSNTTLKAIRCETGGTVFSSVVAATFSQAAGGSGGGGGGGSISTPATPASSNGAGTPATPATPPSATPGQGNGRGEVLGAAAYNFTKDLSSGMSGTDVVQLQQFLIAEGFDIPAITAGHVAFGYFGGETKAAVIAFQKANGITPSAGYVGAVTRALLNKGVITTTPEHATNLSQDQVNAIISVLESFNVDATTLAKVKAALGQ